MRVNQGIVDLCLKINDFASNRWHPQHKNKSCLYTPMMIERGQFEIPPPDISPQRLKRLEEATRNYYFFLKDSWFQRMNPRSMENLNMQAVGQAIMNGFFDIQDPDRTDELSFPGGRLKEMMETHMSVNSAPAHLDDVERTLCRKCRHPKFENNPNHWGNFMRLIDKGGWLPLFYLLLDSLMAREGHLLLALPECQHEEPPEVGRATD